MRKKGKRKKHEEMDFWVWKGEREGMRERT